MHDYVKFPSMSLYDASYDSVDIPREALSSVIKTGMYFFFTVLYSSFFKNYVF